MPQKRISLVFGLHLIIIFLQIFIFYIKIIEYGKRGILFFGNIAFISEFGVRQFRICIK